MFIKSVFGRRGIVLVGKIWVFKVVVDDVIYVWYDECFVEINFVIIGGRVLIEFDIVIVVIFNIF